MSTPTVDVGQVWEHRAHCRLCKTGVRGGEHRHRYLVLAVEPDTGSVIVRDLSTGRTKLEPFGRYPRPLCLFGSLAKGGLRLAGHWVQGRFAPVAPGDLDVRLVEHDRIQMRGTPRPGKPPRIELAA